MKVILLNKILFCNDFNFKQLCKRKIFSKIFVYHEMMSVCLQKNHQVYYIFGGGFR